MFQLSEISKILGAYKDALDNSQNRYEDLCHDRAKNAIQFYNDFFKNLIRPYKTLVEDPAGRRQSMRLIERVFGTTEIKFAAVDGKFLDKPHGRYTLNDLDLDQ